MTAHNRKLTLVLALLLPFSTLQAETLNLSAAFVNQYKNRATITAQFELDAISRLRTESAAAAMTATFTWQDALLKFNCPWSERL